MNAIGRERRKLRRLNRKLATSKVKGPADYPEDPVGYATNILKVTVTDDQADILRSLLKAPYRVLVKAGHSTGKTFLAAIAVNWWYDSFDPGVCITTAPTDRDVKDLLWKEIRMQRQRVGLGGLQPAAAEMRTSPGHYAKGFTATSGSSFVGRHDARMLLVFDEAVGVDPVFWETASTMFRAEPGHAWLAIFNPTSSASWAFIEDQATVYDYATKTTVPKWHRFSLDCLNHPNVKGKGPLDKKIVDAAVSWVQVDTWVQQWCTPVPQHEATATDLEWPMQDCPVWEEKSRRFWKQGPSFLARCRGIWPSGGGWTVWNDLLWSEALQRGGMPPPVNEFPELGIDASSGAGEDYSSIHVRWGHESYYHESSNAWKAPELMAKIRALAVVWAARATANRVSGADRIDPKSLKIKIDDDLFGRAVTQMLQAEGYRVIPISAASKSISGLYPNRRSELWFQVADRAVLGYIGLKRLALSMPAVIDRLRQQGLMVEFALNAAGMRVVEPKDITREKIGRSPDDFDAMNLAYLEGSDYETARFIESPHKPIKFGEIPRESLGKKLFGGGNP